MESMSLPDLSTRGKLLVATPPLGDPNFDRSVVYMIEHGTDGAVGVVLNRPTSQVSIDGLESWVELLTPPSLVFNGGPVEADALIAIASTDAPDASWASLGAGVGTVDLSMEPIDAPGRIARLRIFRGYAGWSPFQLDGELAAGAWMVLPAEVDDLFTGSPEQLWRLVLRRQGGRLAWIADAPDDLSSN